MLTILIRTSYRPKQFKELLSSIETQMLKGSRIIVSYDDDRALEYIPEYVEKVRVYKNDDCKFFYDDYCNTLKSLVTEGHAIFIDDDDVIIDKYTTARLCSYLQPNKSYIVQFSRNGLLKPTNKDIRKGIFRKGKIGMPCLVFWHEHKDLSDIDCLSDCPDYNWIEGMSRQVKLEYLPLEVVFSKKRGFGSISTTIT